MEVKVGPDYQFPNVTEFFNGCFVLYMYFPNGSDGKESACNVGDPGSIPGIFPGEGHVSAFQYSCLENSMDRGAWRATIHGFAKNWTQLSN